MVMPRCSCCGRRAAVVVILVKAGLEARRVACEKDGRTLAARAIKLRHADMVAVRAVAA